MSQPLPDHVFAAVFPIRTDLVDWERKLSLSGLFLFLQEIAWEHANTWNFGYEQLNEKGQFWVLSKLKVQIDHYPQWNDELQLHTWGKEPEVLTAYRDFIGYNQHGLQVFKATSAWHILSSTTGRPQRVDVMKAFCPIPEGLHAITEQPDKLPAPAGGIKSAVHAVVLSDIDMNRHVNNTRYIQWILDSFPPDFAMEHQVRDIEVNFLQQARLGDAYYIVTEHRGGGVYLSAAIRESDHKDLVRIETRWTKNAQP